MCPTCVHFTSALPKWIYCLLPLLKQIALRTMALPSTPKIHGVQCKPEAKRCHFWHGVKIVNGSQHCLCMTSPAQSSKSYRCQLWKNQFYPIMPPPRHNISDKRLIPNKQEDVGKYHNGNTRDFLIIPMYHTPKHLTSNNTNNSVMMAILHKFSKFLIRIH